MKVQRITLEQMLAARDRRAAIQNMMLDREGGTCLVCLTLNIAGDIKRTPMTAMLFRSGLEMLDSLGFTAAGSRIIDEPTGSEAFRLLREDADQVKQKLEAVEESFPAARLFDFDVLMKDSSSGIRKLSRKVSRKCLVCGGPVSECARSRRHGLDAVRSVTEELLKDFCADTLADAAYNALLDELYTTPKPGLVDLASCGAHTDMDVTLFEKSAESLKPYFRDAARMGMNDCSMKELRMRGVSAEKEMFEATGGVNTHKGAVYSMGLLLAGMGRTLTDTAHDEAAFDMAVRYASELALQDAGELLVRSQTEPKTNGGQALRDFGARGATGEAADGFPDAVSCAARLRYYMNESCEWLKAGSLAFCDCMAELEDTNLLHRGGRNGLDFARKEASRIAAIRDFEKRIYELAVLDTEMISRNLSPGGSADMLALAYLLERWRMMNEYPASE